MSDTLLPIVTDLEACEDTEEFWAGLKRIDTTSVHAGIAVRDLLLKNAWEREGIAKKTIAHLQEDLTTFRAVARDANARIARIEDKVKELLS